MDYRLDDQQRQEIFLNLEVSRLALDQPIQWELEALSLVIKWHRHNVDHSSPSNAG
jgi:hypothetical protein